MSILTGASLASPGRDSLTRTPSTAVPATKATVGTQAFAADGPFIYVTAAGATTVSGQAVMVSGGGLNAVVVSVLGSGNFIGIAEAPFASGDSGYIRVGGTTLAIVDSGAVAGDGLQLSATAGNLKKITTSGDQVAIALAASDNASTAAIKVYITG